MSDEASEYSDGVQISHFSVKYQQARDYYEGTLYHRNFGGD